MKHRMEFDRTLRRILKELPKEVRTRLREVPLIVEDEPSAELLDDLRIPLKERDPPDLCGLHWNDELPGPSEDHRIFIFRGPIRRLAGRSKRELERQIRITVLHEIGHLFGMSEEKLEELGYE